MNLRIKSKIILIIVTIGCYLCSCNVYASDCISKVVSINKGEEAPCTGYLFSPEAEEEAWKTKETNKILEKREELNKQKEEMLNKQLEIKDLIIEKKDEQVNIYHTKLVDTTKKYVDSQEGRGSRDLLFIGLGVLATVLASVVVKNVSSR